MFVCKNPKGTHVYLKTIAENVLFHKCNNHYSAKRDYCRFKHNLLANQITVIWNKMNVQTSVFAKSSVSN